MQFLLGISLLYLLVPKLYVLALNVRITWSPLGSGAELCALCYKGFSVFVLL